MLALKAYIGNNKNKFSQKVTSCGDWTWDLLHSSLILSYLS